MGERLSIEARIAQATQRWPWLEFKRKSADEASAPCPFCRDGRDRFLVFANGGYWCRKCETAGWLDDDDPKPLSKDELLELRVKELERKQREQETRLERLEEMHECKDHLRYHEAMTTHEREYWYREGIFDEAIDTHLLGHCGQCPTDSDNRASYTIPVFDVDGALCNIRHRLENAINGDKYRPHRAGLGQHLYGADALNQNTGRLLVLEGEKKTIVFQQANYPAVGVMGASGRWKRAWFDWIKQAGPQSVTLCFDPGAEEHAWRLGEAFTKAGFRDTRVARFPVKPDDMIVHFSAGADDVEAVLRAARPV